jgi:two-component system, OmpR family, alkaline phosphatase synthesis response regulator PhoP
MAHESILAVEDDEDILELLKYNLAKEGYRVTAVTTGEEGLHLAHSTTPDLILLDLMLPGVDGLEVCRSLKMDAKTRLAPIIMLTAKGEEADIVTGLELGAEDYITKPFSTRVLLARVRTVLRRRRTAPPGEDALLKIHDLVIDPGRHEVLVQGQPVDLTATEFRLLHLLARRPGWVLTRGHIVEGIHGDDYPVTDRAVDVKIVALRKKLGPAAQYVETVRGVGYRFKG